MGSQSCLALATYFSEKLHRKVWQVTRDSTKYIPKPGRLYINWGCASNPSWWKSSLKILNKPSAVSLAGDKLRTFRKLLENSHITIPEFTNDINQATGWLGGRNRIVCRAVLSGHSGAGISIVDSGSLPTCPLYVKYIPKEKEFRVHVFKGQVIDVQQKRLRGDYTGVVDKQVRNVHTGWVYCRDNIQQPDGMADMAIQTVSTLGLDFGAVDIIYSKTKNKFWVLEVNTAPGLEGHSIEIYGNAFRGAL